MKKYMTVPLRSILKQPEDPEDYLCVQNKYWALDSKNNIFLSSIGRPIYGKSKRTVRFYIERLELPVTFSYKIYPWVFKSTNRHRADRTDINRKKQYNLIRLEFAWILKR